MCVYYTDLNKHYPKDPFGLPWIDQVIDSTACCNLLCFLDCYSWYHQITIKEEDQEKTVFITPFGAYCYTTMSFGLKNVGTTYQLEERMYTISKLRERGLPFFKLLKHQKKFVWTTEADQALAQLKDFLSKPPILTAPHKKRSSYCSTSPRLLMWSVLPSLSSGRKTTTHT
jgi:hypothetical protein